MTKPSGLETLADRVATAAHELGYVRVGGCVSEVAPDAFRLRGLSRHVRLGDRVEIAASDGARLALQVVATAGFTAARRLLDGPPRATELSAREREVLGWTALGRRQTDIAAGLGLSARTVENHLRRIRQKLGVATTAQAVGLALQRGQIDA